MLSLFVCVKSTWRKKVEVLKPGFMGITWQLSCRILILAGKNIWINLYSYTPDKEILDITLRKKFFSHIPMHMGSRNPCAFLPAAKSIPYQNPCGIRATIYERAHTLRCYIRDSSHASRCVCGGGGGRGGLTSYIWHSGIVRMCVPNSPLFQRCQVYDWPPFFNKKCMNGPIFLDPMWKAPFFWHPGRCTYFSLRDFSWLLILLVLYELTVIFV